MSAATDKARFYLEQSIPELKEYEKRKIFSSDEISSIMKKRSDFEHKINGRGASPADFARYAEYEMNLDALRRKRIKRLGIRGPSHTGQRRIFFILDRATRRFHGDIGLWMQYIEYTRKQRAHKKLSQVFTNALRLHPTEVELWICAARYALEEHGDMTQARAYMQRGLRFCRSSNFLWIQYAKLEMIYIARIAARQKILGLDTGNSEEKPQEEIDTETAAPQLTSEDVNPTLEKDEADQVALETLNSTPALSGAIPIAVFDAAMQHFSHDDQLGRKFYDAFAEFEDMPCLKRVLNHVVEQIMASSPTSAQAQICYIKLPVHGIKPTSPHFPRSFAESLGRLKSCAGSQATPELSKEIIEWLGPLIATEDLDPALHQVMKATLNQAERTATAKG